MSLKRKRQDSDDESQDSGDDEPVKPPPAKRMRFPASPLCTICKQQTNHPLDIALCVPCAVDKYAEADEEQPPCCKCSKSDDAKQYCKACLKTVARRNPRFRQCEVCDEFAILEFNNKAGPACESCIDGMFGSADSAKGDDQQWDALLRRENWDPDYKSLEEAKQNATRTEENTPERKKWTLSYDFGEDDFDETYEENAATGSCSVTRNDEQWGPPVHWSLVQAADGSTIRALKL